MKVFLCGLKKAASYTDSDIMRSSAMVFNADTVRTLA